MIQSLTLGLVALSGTALAQTPEGQDNQPIAGAGSWMLQRRLPGMPGLVCTIRTEGPEANTTILLNNDRRPVLIIGRGDWSGHMGEARATLSIDGGRPIRLEAAMLQSIVLVLIEPALLDRLRAAQTLDWTLPFGRFRANVAGLGTAFDALSGCTPAPEG